IGCLRIERTLQLIRPLQVIGAKVVDVGCGAQNLSKALASLGSDVTAVDVSEDRFCHAGISYVKACAPYLPFSDASFEGVVCTDVIAKTPPPLHRLAVSELSRLLSRTGWAVISTSLDLASIDAYAKFLDLITTEFEVEKSTKSSHRLHLYLSRIFKSFKP